MKNPRTLLIEQAATDDADEGTAWMERMEAWLALHYRAIFESMIEQKYKELCERKRI